MLVSAVQCEWIIIIYIYIYMHMYAKLLQSWSTLCNPMDYSQPGSSVHRIHQAIILEWMALPSSRGSSRPKDRTHISLCLPALAGMFFTTVAIWEAYIYIYMYIYSLLFEPACPFPSHTSRSLQNARLGSLCYTAASHYLSILLKLDRVYISMLLSQFVLPSPSPIVSTSPFSMSVLPFLPCK